MMSSEFALAFGDETLVQQKSEFTYYVRRVRRDD